MRLIVINLFHAPLASYAMNSQSPSPLRAASANQPLPAHSSKPRMSSTELFGNASELIIEHRGEEYRLKLTRNQRLILNK